MLSTLKTIRDLLIGTSLFAIIPVLVIVQWFVIFVLSTLISPLSYVLNSAATLLFFSSLLYFVLHDRHPIEMGYYMLGVSFILVLLPVFLDRILHWVTHLGAQKEIRR